MQKYDICDIIVLTIPKIKFIVFKSEVINLQDKVIKHGNQSKN